MISITGSIWLCWKGQVIGTFIPYITTRNRTFGPQSESDGNRYYIPAMDMDFEDACILLLKYMMCLYLSRM